MLRFAECMNVLRLGEIDRCKLQTIRIQLVYQITVVTRRSQGCLSVLRISRAGGSAQRGISKPKPRENISIEFRKGKSYTTTFAQTLQLLSAR